MREDVKKKVSRYIYAVLYSNAYREKYAEFPNRFPTHPVYEGVQAFSKLAEKGREFLLVQLACKRGIPRS